MKLTVPQPSLSQALQTVYRAVSPRTPLSYLNAIFLSAHGGILTLKATDLELSITASLNVTVEEEGQALLPARLFQDIARHLPPSDAILTVNESYVGTLETGSLRFTINGIDPSLFPAIDEITSGNTYLVPSSALDKNLKQVLVAAAREDVRPVLTGLLLDFSGDAPVMVATDGIRLTVGKIPLVGQPPFTERQAIIPARALAEVTRLATMTSADQVTLTIGSNQVGFDFGNVRLISRLIEGTFPNYRQVIPVHYQTVMRVGAKELLASCERAALVSRDNSNAIALTLNPEGLTISSNDPEQGSFTESLPGEVSGEPITILFNARLLTEGLKLIEGEEILFEFTGPYSPARIREVENSDYLYILLPLRGN